MQNPLRDKLESAALRLDDFLDAAQALGPRESILLSAARDIAQAIELLTDGFGFAHQRVQQIECGVVVGGVWGSRYGAGAV